MADKTHLIEQLTAVHRATETRIADLAPDLVIHADSGWRLHDIIGHIAVWYGVRVQALRAWQQGETFVLPGIDLQAVGGYNQVAFGKRRAWTYAAILADWQQSFNDLIAEVEAIDPAKLDAEMTYPWNAPGTVGYLIERMITHAQEHLDEIQQAAAGS